MIWLAVWLTMQPLPGVGVGVPAPTVHDASAVPPPNVTAGIAVPRFPPLMVTFVPAVPNNGLIDVTAGPYSNTRLPPVRLSTPPIATCSKPLPLGVLSVIRLAVWLTMQPLPGVGVGVPEPAVQACRGSP